LGIQYILYPIPPAITLPSTPYLSLLSHPLAFFSIQYLPLKPQQETPTKRQATQYDCLPSLLGVGDNGIEKVYGEEKNIFYWADYIEQPRQNNNLFYRHD
jgi:hypothetical protein